jgi:hypothetical protein
VYAREKLVEILAGEFVEADEHDGDCDHTDLGPDAPVIVVTADSL